MDVAAPATGVRPVPWVGVSAIVVGVTSGMLLFLLGGAPPVYIAMNGLALLLGLGLVAAFPVGRMRGRGATWAAAIGIAGVGISLASGFDLEGVRRWLPLGPVRLHTAMLFLPMIAVLMPRLTDRTQLAALGALAMIFALQPDRAAALALAAGFAFSRPVKRGYQVTALGTAIALAAIAITLVRSDPLEPVPFVEGVVPRAFVVNPLLGLFIGAALAFACAAPLLARGGDRRAARGLAGAMAGFTLASVFGAYPVPLAGYGASPILGYALALALLRAPIVPQKAE
jgi:hypothetical protein